MERDLYARLGIGEYWLFDPSGSEHYGEPLVGQCMEDGAYRRMEMNIELDGMRWARGGALNLDLRWSDGSLRFYDFNAGIWLQNMDETDARAEVAVVRADAAEARMAEMAAELRRLRGE